MKKCILHVYTIKRHRAVEMCSVILSDPPFIYFLSHFLHNKAEYEIIESNDDMCNPIPADSVKTRLSPRADIRYIAVDYRAVSGSSS